MGSNLGTGLRAGAMVKVPHFSGRSDFKKVLGRMGLQARGTAGVDSASSGGTWDISNADRLGKSEIELVNIFIGALPRSSDGNRLSSRDRTSTLKLLLLAFQRPSQSRFHSRPPEE